MSVSNTGPQPKLVQVHSTLLRSNQNGPVLDSGIVEMIYFVVFEKETFSRGTFPFKKLSWEDKSISLSMYHMEQYT